jgi:predicted dehydrogenase
VSTPIRTAVLGYGLSGRVFHAPFLATDPRYSLDLVVTGDPERAESARRTHPGIEVVATADDLLARAADVDLVVLGTPPPTHVPLARQALDAGLHVVVDKPFAPTVAEAEELIEHADRVGRRLTVFQNRRWDGDLLTLKRLIECDELGAVQTFESRFEWWKPEGPRTWKATTGIAEGGGILFDLGTHLIDQALHLFGPVARVQADVARRADSTSSDADDDVVVILVHESGVRSVLTTNSWAALPAPRFVVRGSKASYVAWGLDGQEPYLRDGGWPSDEAYGVYPPERWGTLGVGDDTRSVKPERGDYGAFYRLLADALTGTGPLPVDPREALETLRIIEVVHAEARQSR